MKSDSGILLPQNDECAFCAYLRGERPYTILYRDSETATFVTREQRGNPHLLVLPLRHAHTIIDLSDQEAASLILSVRTAAAEICRVYGSPGISIWQNNGISAGQAINHVHFHVAGTLEKGGTEMGAVPELSIDETEKISNRFKAAH